MTPKYQIGMLSWIPATALLVRYATGGTRSLEIAAYSVLGVLVVLDVYHLYTYPVE